MKQTIIILLLILTGIGVYLVVEQNSTGNTNTTAQAPISAPMTTPVVSTTQKQPPSQSNSAQNSNIWNKNGCAISAQIFNNSFTDLKRSAIQEYFGPGSDDSYSYTYHYNNLLAECFVSIHETVTKTKYYGAQYDYYYVFNTNDSIQISSAIGVLWYNSPATGAPIEIVNCSVNGTPCSSIDGYGNLIFPYLNN